MFAGASLHAIACATCSLDSSQQGQTFMVVAMLAIPVVAVVVGVLVARRILRNLSERLAP